MKNENLTFLVTVQFTCKNMIDKEELEKQFNSDPAKAYKFISDNHKDSVYNFSSGKQKVIKVEIKK